MPETTKEQAEIAKLQAETAETNARMARAVALAQQADERASYRKRVMAAEARVAEIGLAKSERDEKTVLSDWKYQHIYPFLGGMDRASVQACIDRLNMWSATDPGCDMQITFNSPGGSVLDGYALFDYIRYLRSKPTPHKITAVALGYAASMAGIVLQAADIRVMAKDSWLLIHELSFSAGGKIGEVEDSLEFGKRLKEQAANIFVERSGGKLARAVLTKNWTRRDWWVSSDEALALGLIDSIW